MTVYIEYAFLQNFLLDGVLLFLAFFALKIPLSWGRLLLSASVGGVASLAFPLLQMATPLSIIFKIAVGLLLPLLAFSKLSTKKQWGQYLWAAGFFLGLTFLFGGALTGVMQTLSLSALPFYAVLIGFLFLTFFALLLVQKWYEQKSLHALLYDCVILANGKKVKARGFWDSGNRATKGGIPVCFLSPALLFDLWGELLFNEKEGGQVWDEMQIATPSGEKRVRLYKGVLEIQKEGKTYRVNEVYFARLTNTIAREYEMILPSRIFE